MIERFLKVQITMARATWVNLAFPVGSNVGNLETRDRCVTGDHMGNVEYYIIAA